MVTPKRFPPIRNRFCVDMFMMEGVTIKRLCASVNIARENIYLRFSLASHLHFYFVELPNMSWSKLAKYKTPLSFTFDLK